jgi:hypothetical protein
MIHTTLSKTVRAIVERSGEVRVPVNGRLTLVGDSNGRYRLAEKLFAEESALQGRLRPRGPDGRRLRPGHVLTGDEVEYLVRGLLGLDEIADAGA